MFMARFKQYLHGNSFIIFLFNFLMFTVIFSCKYNALANLASIFVFHEAIWAGHSTFYIATLQLYMWKSCHFQYIDKNAENFVGI